LSEPQIFVFGSKSLRVQNITSSIGIGLKSTLRNVASNLIKILSRY